MAGKCGNIAKQQLECEQKMSGIFAVIGLHRR